MVVSVIISPVVGQSSKSAILQAAGKIGKGRVKRVTGGFICIVAKPACNAQPWKFIVVQSPEVREALVGHSWGQRQVADASHLVVFAAKKQLTDAEVDAFLARTAEVRGGSVDSLAGYRKVVVGFRAKAEQEGWLEQWAKHQTYIALGQLMTAASALGIDACPMEGLDPAKYDEVLGLAEHGLTTVTACPLGYRSEADKYASLPKVRFAKESVIEYR